MSPNEALTRLRLIDPQLRQAQCRLDDKTHVRREIPVDGYDAEPWNGVTDYCLYEPGGQVLAVVEAKRCSRSPRDADEQLRHYVTEIAKRQSFAPFGFMSNGHATHFWELGQAKPRLVAGFFTPEDLQRLLFIRQNGQPLAATPCNSSSGLRRFARCWNWRRRWRRSEAPSAMMRLAALLQSRSEVPR